MKLYVIETVLDELVILGITRSKTVAEFQRDEINENGGVGYCHSEAWIEEYQLNKDDYIRF